MKNLLEKIGTDKVLHFFGGGFICSIFAIMSLLQEGMINNRTVFGSIAIGTVVALIASIIKELVDDKFDWVDILAAIIGCALIFISAGLGMLFNVQS